MQVISSLATLRQHLGDQRMTGKRIGLVPTMGFLHDGHLSLVRAARQDCDVVVMSIFVNPKQFGPNEDFASYPRDMERDLRLARDSSVDVVFTPDVSEVYPEGFQSEVSVRGLTEGLCGAARPGHFDGVTTVVAKLFNMVGPDRSYFGQKDYQQAAVIERMVLDLNMPLTVVVCPIVREPDGLAMSSRNAYLSPDERRAALVLLRALQVAASRIAEGERRAQSLAAALHEVLAAEPLVRIDYVAVCDPKTLAPVEALPKTVLVALAVYIGRTRLIDNALYTVPQET
ncbi:pantoate--beta-alanine ligase [Candidatus Entotheonella serta]|nr:pantoate--beta-alanine ligase [Candidatus Entotheonella serta]